MPPASATPSATFRPNTWKNGSVASPTSLGRDPQARVRLHLADVRGEVAVREHRRAGRAGGPRREEQDRELAVVTLDLGRHRLRRRAGRAAASAPGSSSRCSAPRPHTTHPRADPLDLGAVRRRR